MPSVELTNDEVSMLLQVLDKVAVSSLETMRLMVGTADKLQAALPSVSQGKPHADVHAHAE